MEKWTIYVQEARTQILFARGAYSDFEEARRVADVKAIFYNLHHFMVHVAGVDRLVNFRAGSARAKFWAGTIDLKGIDLKPARRLRNHLEHYDERLDKWVANHDGAAFFDMNLTTGAIGFPYASALRVLDGDAFRFMGESFALPELLNMIQLLDKRLEALFDG